MSTKSEKKCRKKLKFHETILKKWWKRCPSVYEWYLIFSVIQRREILKNEEKLVCFWVVWNIIVKILSYNPKKNVVITCRFQQKKHVGKKQKVFFWQNTIFVTNIRDIIHKTNVKNDVFWVFYVFFVFAIQYVPKNMKKQFFFLLIWLLKKTPKFVFF